MSIVACPRCRDEVTVPAHVSDDALVRCPLCSEEYTLSEATRQLPPTLIVVGPGNVVPVPMADDEGLELSQPVDAPRPVVLRDTPVNRPVAAARRARRQRNPAVEALKIVGGGAIGLAIGQLILWWMPGDWDESNRDPASLARHVAYYAPWIVPEQLRADPEASGEAEAVSAPTARSTKRPPPPSLTPPAPASIDTALEEEDSSAETEADDTGFSDTPGVSDPELSEPQPAETDNGEPALTDETTGEEVSEQGEESPEDEPDASFIEDSLIDDPSTDPIDGLQ